MTKQARWEWVDRGARTLTIPDTKNGYPRPAA